MCSRNNAAPTACLCNYFRFFPLLPFLAAGLARSYHGKDEKRGFPVADKFDNPCAVSQELINLVCLQCGELTSGNIITIVECARCGALDYHIFRGYVPVDDASSRRTSLPDNKDVVNKMIDLVQRKTRA